MRSPLRDSGPLSGEDHSFATTRWSIVVAARDRKTPQGTAALEELCRRYRYPLYAYVRAFLAKYHRQADPSFAQDVTQAFFVRLLSKDVLEKVDPGRARFRAFLKTSVINFLRNEQDYAAAGKRGGDQAIISIDLNVGESFYRLEPVDTLTPDQVMDRQWVRDLLDQVRRQLKQEWEARGKAAAYEQLQGIMAGEAGDSYAQIGANLGMSESAIKVTVHRLRARFKEILRQQVADGVESEQAVGEEIRELFEAAGGR